MQSKVLPYKKVREKVARARKGGKVIVATNGCFDILHVGHVRNFASAKKLGDILVVGVNSDASVRENKGPTRPIVPARERAEVVAGLESVDYVFIFSGKTPFSWIKDLKPDIHVKGGGADVRMHPDFPEQERIIASYGGKLVLLKHVSGKSTSNIVRKIQESKKPESK